MRTFRVALAQVVSGADPYANLEQVRSRTAEAAAAGADLVVFPEATMRCFGLPLGPVAEPLDGRWAEGVRAAARESGVTVVVGMFTPSPDGRVVNTLLATGPGVESSYDKVHLYDAFGFLESDTVAPGDALVTVEVPTAAGAPVTLGLTTCYDVRFPALYTGLADRGAEVICVATSWGAGPTKVEQWRVLARARALDSTCFVVGAAQADPATVGVTPRGTAPTGVGHSLAVAPDGTVLAELDDAPGLLVVDLDLDRVAEVRRVIPVLANRQSFAP